jgi:hypothetical protein
MFFIAKLKTAMLRPRVIFKMAADCLTASRPKSTQLIRPVIIIFVIKMVTLAFYSFEAIKCKFFEHLQITYPTIYAWQFHLIMWPESAVSQNVVSCCTYRLCVSSHVEILHNSKSDNFIVTQR